MEGAGIGDRAMSVGQLQRGGQRDGSRRLNLDRPPTAAQARDLPGLFEGIDVLGEKADRPSRHRAGASRQSIATRDGVDGDVDQQGSGAPDDVGAHSPGRQFDQMGHCRAQLADDDFGRRSRGRPGPRPDAGGGCENTHRTTVFDRCDYALVRMTMRRLALCAAALLAASCTRVVEREPGIRIRHRAQRILTSAADAARPVPDAGDHRRRRASDDHPVDGYHLPGRHRHPRPDRAAGMPVRLRRNRDVRTRRRGVPQNHLSGPAARRHHLRRRRGVSRWRYRAARVRGFGQHRPATAPTVRPAPASSANGMPTTGRCRPGPATAAAITCSRPWC